MIMKLVAIPTDAGVGKPGFKFCVKVRSGEIKTYLPCNMAHMDQAITKALHDLSNTKQKSSFLESYLFEL